MTALIHRALFSAFVFLLSGAAAATDHGRAAGTFDVAGGRARYTIPIWTPPGPNGLQPSIALSYDSGSGNGVGGVGWNLAAVSSIERCQRTKAQDGVPAGIELSSNDRFCIGGSRMRLISGAYGGAGSVYFTEIADYSRITAYGTEGNGPRYFIVEAKNGTMFEYGGVVSARVFAGVSPAISTTVYRWMLNKVYDRNGNNYIVAYNNLNGSAVPDVICWTPTSLGSSTYRYEAKFNYSSRADTDSYFAHVKGFAVIDRNRLESIQIKSAGVVKRKYRFTYDTSPVTNRSRLDTAKECADDAETNCLLPINFDYQLGVEGVAAGTGSVPAGSGNPLKGRFDFNGDGKDDVLYQSSGTWYAALGANTGFAGPHNTGVTGSIVADRFLPNGRDGIATVVSGTLRVYRWDDASSAFVGHNTGLTTASPSIAADFDGDGLADIVHFAAGTSSFTVRRNTSTGATNPSFSASTITVALSGGNTFGNLWSYFGDGLQRADINGDGRQEIFATILVPYTMTTIVYSAVLFGDPSSGFSLPSQGSWTLGDPYWISIRLNDDRCTDRVIGNVVHVAYCDGENATTVNIPATPLTFLDWNGDGRTDVLVNNGGTFGIYRSTGTGFSSISATTISSSGTFYALDQDGDQLDDLVKINPSGALNYWTHTPSGYLGTSFATNVPDLLSTATDGFGVTATFAYASTSQSAYYATGAATNYPLQEAREKTVVAQLTSSNGIGATFSKNYFYVGARENAERKESAGFQRIDETDSRNGLISRTYFEQPFPIAGMVSQQELKQPDGTTVINRAVFTNSFATLDSSANNQRFFVYPSASTSTQYEVGGTFNAALLRTVTTTSAYDTASGALISQTVTTSEPSGAGGVAAGGSWEAYTYIGEDHLLNDTTNWCLGRPKQVLQVNSHNLTHGTAIQRQVNTNWDAVKCRPYQTIDEQGNANLRVVTDIDYDSFGNVNSTTVTGIGMDPRTTSAIYSDGTFTTGQFPLSVTNAEGHVTLSAWNYDLGVPSNVTDPNGLVTGWIYDAFGRRTRENRPDSTFTTWEFQPCTGCSANLKMIIDRRENTPAGMVSRSMAYLDQLDRSIAEYQLRADNNYNITERAFDGYGRVVHEYFPYTSSTSPIGSTTNFYDLLNRLTATSRPISESNSTLQTTNIYHEGLTTRVVDAQGKQSRTIVNAVGQVVRSIDHQEYFQAFFYDPFGNVKDVFDQVGNTLQSSTYNLRGMLTQRTDLDMGTWNFTPNALGETVSQTDAKSQTTTFEFDKLGRLKRRTETEGITNWVWGTSVGAKNIGQLQSVAGPGYSESYGYDSWARPHQTTVYADTTYNINFTYNSFGALDTLTYPESTPNSPPSGSNYRLKLQYEYQNGILKSIKDFNAPTTVFWTANVFNARNQITNEGLGNGLFTLRAFDGVTGWLKSIQSGLGGGTGVQNLAYEWDQVGNLKKRKDLNQSNLTEEFFYDNLYRLDYSTLNTVQNLNLDYDALGNITSKSDVGTYTYHATKKHQVSATSNGWSFTYDPNGNMETGRGATITWKSFNYPLTISRPNGIDATFSYTPDRQYWKQVSNYPAAPPATGTVQATTIYVGGLLEKVTVGSNTDYRHVIQAGSGSVIVSRQTNGVNNSYYLSGDHLGSNVVFNGTSPTTTYSSYDAFGRRRGSNWVGSPSVAEMQAIAGVTRRGYTDHTMLDNLELIHMTGRVQDPLLGRFISADPFIPHPTNTRSYNRYSYVYNNPLSYVDPGGFTTTGTANDDGEQYDCRSSGSVCADSARARAEEERQRTASERDDENRRGAASSHSMGHGISPSESLGGTGGSGIGGAVAGTCAPPLASASAPAIPISGTGKDKSGQRVQAGWLARGLGTLFATLSLSGSTPQPTTPIFRSVGPVELAQIAATQQYAPSPSGFGEKQFWLDLTSAQAYANITVARGWESSAAVVQSMVSVTTMSQGVKMTLDSMQAVSFPVTALAIVNADAAKSGGIRVVHVCGGEE